MAHIQNKKEIELIAIKENNESSMSSTNVNVSKGLFIKPSQNVPDRSTDVTGMVLMADNSLGKVKWISPSESSSVGFNEGSATVNEGSSTTVDSKRGAIEYTNPSGILGNTIGGFTLNHNDITSNSFIFLTVDGVYSEHVVLDYLPPTDGSVFIRVINFTNNDLISNLLKINYFIIV